MIYFSQFRWITFRMWFLLHLFSSECVGGQERQCGWNTHAARHISGQPYNTDSHRYRRGRPQGIVCVCVCALPVECFYITLTYPVQSFGLYVPQQLLSPICRHPRGDVLRFLWDDRPYFDGVLRRFLRAGCQSVVRGHLLQQGSHGGTSWHWTGLKTWGSCFIKMIKY